MSVVIPGIVQQALKDIFLQLIHIYSHATHTSSKLKKKVSDILGEGWGNSHFCFTSISSHMGTLSALFSLWLTSFLIRKKQKYITLYFLPKFLCFLAEFRRDLWGPFILLGDISLKESRAYLVRGSDKTKMRYTKKINNNNQN